MSDYDEYEAMPNKAFSSMVLSFATSMKVSGATDDEIQEAMNNLDSTSKRDRFE